MRVTHWMICLALGNALCGASALVNADGLPPGEVIKNRIHNFREIGTAYKGIRDELKSPEPYLPSIQESAGQIESMGSEILSWFPPGTGPVAEPEPGFLDTVLSWFASEDPAKAEGKTKAKPAVWTQWAAFERAQQNFHAEALKMTEVAQSGNKTAVAAQFKVLGETCRKCHQSFREKIEGDDRG